MFRRFMAIVVIASLFLSSVSFVSTSLAYSPEPSQSEQDQIYDEIKTLDDRFVEVAQQVPGFGGMFFDESGQLTMYLVDNDLDMQQKAEAAILTVFSNDPRITGANPNRIIPGRYGFLQLKEWYDLMSVDILGIPGVILTDIDEVNNRLRIGIENQEVQVVVGNHLANLGVPWEAVIIEVRAPLHFLVNLRDKRRPLVGGLLISFKIDLLNKMDCTLGVIANRVGVKGMVINSHCTKKQGGVENTVYYQPGVWFPNRIGLEIVDPQYSTGSNCPSGRRCRWSDTAFAKIPHPQGPDVIATRGFIARTTGLGSIDINPSKPRFRITSESLYPFAGQILNKIGSTTGWSEGSVSITCVDVNVETTNITLFCQHFLELADGDLGDSGAPIFAIIPAQTTPKTTVNISATTTGWQQTSLALLKGNMFTISYTSGSWTVDSSQFPYVGPEGYPPEIDQQIYQGCKLFNSLPYARLLGRIGSGQTFSVGQGGTFTADESGFLYLRIHDDDSCQWDNDGSVSIRLSEPTQPTGDVSLYGIMWGGNDYGISFSSMDNIQFPQELGPLKTCSWGFDC